MEGLRTMSDNWFMSPERSAEDTGSDEQQLMTELLTQQQIKRELVSSATDSNFFEMAEKN